jgi:hypothetical protein
MTEDLKAVVVREILNAAPKALDVATRSRLLDGAVEFTEQLAQLEVRRQKATASKDADELILLRELVRDVELRAEADLARRQIADSKERQREIVHTLGTAALRVALRVFIA